MVNVNGATDMVSVKISASSRVCVCRFVNEASVQSHGSGIGRLDQEQEGQAKWKVHLPMPQ
jgi:hypothetical protein